MTTNFFSPLSFVAVFGSGIRDPGSGIRDPGSEIRDPGSGMGKNQDPGSGIRDKHPGSATLGTSKNSISLTLVRSTLSGRPRHSSWSSLFALLILI
jgi:hypothetical protein